MIGSEGAGALAAAWLMGALPARLRLMETRLDLPVNSLVDPSLVADHETGPIAIEQWPAVYVLPQKMSGLKLVDVEDGGGETYRVTYPVRFLAWLRADDYGTTDLLRKRYALAIREALLIRKQLTPAPQYLDDRYGQDTSIVTVNPATIREDYSGMVDQIASGTIAGVAVDVDLAFTETLAGAAPLGHVSTAVETDTQHLPPHPGL